MALTLGGGPSQLSEGKFLLKGCVGCRGSPVMWDRECEIWGQKCDHLCSDLTRGRFFLDSTNSPTQQARLRRGAVCRGEGVGPAPSPGPPTNGIRFLPGAFHRPRRQVLHARRRLAAKEPEMTAARRFCAPPTVPEVRSPERSYLRGSKAAPTAAAGTGAAARTAAERLGAQLSSECVRPCWRGARAGERETHTMHGDQRHVPGRGR